MRYSVLRHSMPKGKKVNIPLAIKRLNGNINELRNVGVKSQGEFSFLLNKSLPWRLLERERAIDLAEQCTLCAVWCISFGP